METWDEIRDEVAGMLADGEPLEDVIAKLEKRKNEMKKTKPMTNEERIKSCTTEQLAEWLADNSRFIYECGEKQVAPKTMHEEDWEWWLKEKHNDN